MTQRRFGPTRGAGIAVIEKDSDKTIEAAALGVIGYIGVLEKGKVGELSKTLSKSDFIKKHGQYIPESLVADSVFDYWNNGKGAGLASIIRITDGTEISASITLKSRKDPRTSVVKVTANNGGRWAGKKQVIVGDYTATTQTTLSTGLVMLVDELKGATVTLDAVVSKSYKVESNDAAGILTFASDTTLVTDIGASAVTLYKISLANGVKSVAVIVKDGLLNPTTEWGLEVYNDGILVKIYDDLNSDPLSINYYVDAINDDTDNVWIIMTDLHVGAISTDVRPANYFGKSDTVTTTKLTTRIFEHVGNSVASATAKFNAPIYGSSIIDSTITLAVTTAGVRATGVLTFGVQPGDTDTVVIDATTFTFKTVVSDPLTEVLIGASAEATLDNFIALLNSSSVLSTHALYNLVFAEKATTSTVNIFAQTAGLAGNSIISTSAGVTPPTYGGATLGSGLDQIWSVTHDQLGILAGAITSGVAYVKANEFLLGFTLIDISRDSTKVWAIADTITMDIEPFVPNALVGEILVPDVTERRSQFIIDSNTTFEINVKVGEDLTTVADAGDEFQILYKQELEGGYDGVAGLTDSDYILKLNSSDSPFNELFGDNFGLVKLASPGVTAVAVQKAGVAYAAGRNYQWRYEIPSNITTETAAETHLNDVLGRNDFAVVTFPSFAYVTNPLGVGLKLVPTVGMIHGREAKIAKDFDGYHKAGSDITATLPSIIKLTTGTKILNEEFLNPQGINVIKKIKGNFVAWGDRTAGLDTAFKFKHKRETMSHYENILRENFDFIIFAINSKNSTTQQRLISTLNAFFLIEFTKGALEGSGFDDAVSIKIDEENNTTATRVQGDLNAEIRFRIVDTVERFVITMSQLGVFESIDS